MGLLGFSTGEDKELVSFMIGTFPLAGDEVFEGLMALWNSFLTLVFERPMAESLDSERRWSRSKAICSALLKGVGFLA
jgi:hypothetical protein